MTWVIAGLACAVGSCMWQVPAFDNSYFDTERDCMRAIETRVDIEKFRDLATPYKALKCRRTDSRRPKRLE